MPPNRLWPGGFHPYRSKQRVSTHRPTLPELVQKYGIPATGIAVIAVGLLRILI